MTQGIAELYEATLFGPRGHDSARMDNALTARDELRPRVPGGQLPTGSAVRCILTVGRSARNGTGATGDRTA